MEIKNIDDWKNLLQKAENGDTKAMNEIAFWYEEGLAINDSEIVQVDKKVAFSWVKKSYELGDFEAMEKYADYLTDKGNGLCEPDIELGIKLYERCLQNGSIRAAFCLGLEYRNKQKFDTAFKYYQEAQSNEEFYQEITLALCYYYGIGVTKDKLIALEKLLLIHNNNTDYEIDEANYLIGKIYLEGEVVSQDLEKARYYLELADRDGDHRSAQELLILIGRTNKLN